MQWKRCSKGGLVWLVWHEVYIGGFELTLANIMLDIG